ncbi:hypothetical protein [Pedobacter jamesrossensis]|uniref:Uncharacterized protein n=1 Tax=Pedobacter jamesrossensis TaxID=1908238 RepID=A0ABV8NTN9_9SPHI
MDSSIMTIFYSLISLLSPLLIFIASCYYISKKRSADAVLLIIGSGMSLLLSITYNVLMPYLMSAGNLPASEVTQYYKILGVAGFIGGIFFAVGLFMLIYNTVNSNKIVANQFPLH